MSILSSKSFFCPFSWVWAYWINPFAWSLRGLLINQYGSGKFGEEGNVILQQLGFINSKLNLLYVATLFQCMFLVSDVTVS